MAYKNIKKRRANNRLARKRYVARKRATDLAGWNEYNNTNNRKRLKRDPKKMLLYRAANNARVKGLEFNLEHSDIVVPECCPVLGIPLVYNIGGQKRSPNAPSVDRIDNTKGYIRGNIRIISWRANDLLANGTLDEFRRLVAFLEATQANK